LKRLLALRELDDWICPDGALPSTTTPPTITITPAIQAILDAGPPLSVILSNPLPSLTTQELIDTCIANQGKIQALIADIDVLNRQIEAKIWAMSQIDQEKRPGDYVIAVIELAEL
jgi:hypothetical protein